MEPLAKTALNNANESPDEDKENQQFSSAMQLATSVSLPMVLMAAVRLNLFETIAGAGPGAQLSPSQVADHLAKTRQSMNNPNAAAMLDRMLRLLASHSVLTCSSIDGGGDGGVGNQRVYGLAPVAEYFVRNKRGVPVGPLLELIQDKVFIQSWYELEDTVIEGGVPFDRVHGVHAFDYPGIDPRFNEVFNKAMINHTTIVINRVLEVYNGLEHLKTLVDVGGGLGVTLSIIVKKWPNLRGINFDQLHVIQHAHAYPGVEHVAGDMFERVPDGDAIFMKWILHDWDDDRCLKLLKNCHKALPENGKIIVVDALLPVIPDTSACTKTSCQMDVVMMTQNPKEKRETNKSFLPWLWKLVFKA